MIKIIKKYGNQSALLSIGMIFCCHLSAQNISQQQHKLSHKKPALTCEYTNYPIEKSQISSSKFVMSDRGFDKAFKHNHALYKRPAPKNSPIIDHQIFASPKNIKSTKRIFI